MVATLGRPLGASGLEGMRDALTVPFRAAMITRTIPLAGGAFDMAGSTREPLLLVGLRRPLADELIVVRGTVGGVAIPDIRFGPYSHVDSRLPLHRPDLGESESAGPFTVGVRAFRVTGRKAFQDAPATGAAMSSVNAAALLEGFLIEGRLGRLLYLVSMEGQRVIRQAREIRAMRFVDLVRARAADDMGSDLGVPRFSDTAEDDDHYRARLRLFRGWRLPSPGGLAAALNGPGDPGDLNAGLPSQLGVTERFEMVEETNELGLAMRLVEVGGVTGSLRARFHQLLRGVYLLDLDGPTSTALPEGRRLRLDFLRDSLRTELTRVEQGEGISTVRYLAPRAAVSLDLAVRLSRRLGNRNKIEIVRAYDPAEPLRHELGMGVTLRTFTPSALERMGQAVSSVADGSADELAQLAATLSPRPPDEDPLGAWLFEPCGFRTVHSISTTLEFLSPLPSFGLVVDGPAAMATGGTAEFAARYEGEPSAGGLHVRASEALAQVDPGFAAAGARPVPTTLSPGELEALLQTLSTAEDGVPPDPFEPLVSMGLAVGQGVKLHAQTILATMGLEHIVAFLFPSADLAAMGSGATLQAAMGTRVEILLEAGFHSVRGLWDTAGDRLILLAAVSQLPGATSRLGEPPPASYLWSVAGVERPRPGTAPPLSIVHRSGGRVKVAGDTEGLVVLVAMAYARRGLADPYEIRIGLPETDPATLLDGDQYGYVMNLLDHLHPIGIEVNTFDIRRRHVDLTGAGTAEWLTSRASRTFHVYRQRRPFRFPGGKGAAQG